MTFTLEELAAKLLPGIKISQEPTLASAGDAINTLSFIGDQVYVFAVVTVPFLLFWAIFKLVVAGSNPMARKKALVSIAEAFLATAVMGSLLLIVSVSFNFLA